MVGLVPNIFRRIKLGGIGQKIFHMNSRVPKKTLFNFLSPMDGGAIPQQDHGAPEMFKQSLKERPNIQADEIPCLKPEIKSQPLSPREYRQSTDGGDPVLLVELIQDGGFPFKSPGATNVWNGQKARLINEDKMGLKPFGVFLYGATGKPFNVQSPCRSFSRFGTRVSDNPIPFPEATATYDWGDTGWESASGWFGQSASGSKGLSDLLRPEDPPKAVPLISLSRLETACEGVPEWPWSEGRGTRLLATLETIGKQSFLMLPPNAPRPKDWPCPLSATRWRVDGAFPVHLGSMGSHAPYCSRTLLNVPLFMRKSIKFCYFNGADQKWMSRKR
jgi:hypothetical protein